MRDFSKLLAKGNFTPKERVLLLIADVVSKDRGEKGFLSQADIYALSEGWTPANNDEVREYNRYIQGWRYACFAEMDAQTIYLQAKLKYQSMTSLLNSFYQHPFYSEAKQALDGLAKIKRVKAREATEIMNKQKQEKLKRGLYLSWTIKDFAFEITDEETQKKLTELYDDIDLYEYLDEVQELIDLYGKKDFETIAKRVADKCYNAYAKQYQLFHNYAGIDIAEIAKRYAKENNLPLNAPIDKDGIGEMIGRTAKAIYEKHPDTYKKYIKEDLSKDTTPETDEDSELDKIEELAKILEQHAKEKQTTVEEIIKTACLKWINEGLLEKDYIIEQEERELIAKWIEAKQKAKETLRGFIDKGILKTSKDKDGEDIITGESLYNCGLDYTFVKDFKKQVDTYEPNAGIVLDDKGEYIDTELLIADEDLSWHKINLTKAINLFDALSIIDENEENGEIVLDIKKTGSLKIKDFFLKLRNDFVAHYERLLAFEGLFKRLSKAYDIDLTYRINLWITECGELVDSFNNTLLDALRIENPYSLQANKKKHFKDNELFIDKEKIKPNNPIVEQYHEEIAKILGGDF